MNTKEDVLGALYSYLKAVDISEGSCEAMQSAGYLALDLYWYVFARDINGSHDPKDDVLQLWLIARSGMPDWVFQRFRLARDTDLGPAEECTPNKPRKVNGEFTQEGVHYEWSPLANSLEKNDRTYPLTMSYEQTRKLSGPCVGTKFEEEVSEHNKLCSETVTAAAEVVMCSLNVAPPQIKEHLDKQANLLNVPSVGSTRNTAFPFMQINLVSTQPAGQESKQMKAELGRVGGKHFDSHDTAGGITSMITDSDIDSDTEDWGWFAICDLGIVIELREFIVANFCGLRFHGGFAPTAKLGFAPKLWSHRFTRKFVPKGVLLKLGQDVHSHAKALALLGTWEVNASNPGKLSTASASHKRTRKRSTKSMGRKIDTRLQAKGSRGGILALNGHNRVQMSHDEVSPLDNSVHQRYVNASHLLNNDDDEWVDEDAEDEELDVEMVDEVLGRSLDGDRDDGRSFDDDSDHRDRTVDAECQGDHMEVDDESQQTLDVSHRYMLRKRKRQ
ncbi:hypothetical protein LXA43DRAFT_1103646 [Ganoderma leucocontextum]|nr:hypothetical protein LXA43DRAFT_1103646 [Ganoderma leucocontextum]